MDLAPFAELVALDHGLSVVVTLRGDHSPHSTVVNAGVLAHPLSGADAVGFVAVVGARKLTHLRAIYLPRSWSEPDGGGPPSKARRNWSAPTTAIPMSTTSGSGSCSARSSPRPAEPTTTGTPTTARCGTNAGPLSWSLPPASARTQAQPIYAEIGSLQAEYVEVVGHRDRQGAGPVRAVTACCRSWLVFCWWWWSAFGVRRWSCGWAHLWRRVRCGRSPAGPVGCSPGPEQVKSARINSASRTASGDVAPEAHIGHPRRRHRGTPRTRRRRR